MRRNITGFTLIELLIVVVIIGILVAIAIPRFSSTKEKAYLATMKTDLRNLTTAEEAYATTNNGTYLTTGSTTGPDSITALHYSPTSGVTVTLSASGTSGYAAKATMTGTNRSCDVFAGGGAAKVSGGYAASEGAPACTP